MDDRQRVAENIAISLAPAEEELESLYSKLVNRTERLHAAISDGVIFLDPSGYIESVNQEAERLLGLLETDIRDVKLLDVLSINSVTEDQHIFCENTLIDLFAEGDTYRVDEAFIKIANHHHFPASVTINPVITDSAVDGAVFIFKDISKQKELEETLRERTKRAEDKAQRKAEALQRSEDELRDKSSELIYQSIHDQLTGLKNRAKFDKNLRGVLSARVQKRHEHALIYMDLDQFKIVNENCDHIAGDELLR